MKRYKLIFSLIALLTIGLVLSRCNAQSYSNVWSKKDKADYIYTSLSVDVNMALGLKDNKNSIVEDKGFDWDLELGARYKESSVYIFYGQFNKLNFRSYGAGYDFNIQLSQTLDISAGVYYSAIIRNYTNGSEGVYTAWVSPRGKIRCWISNDLSIELIAKYQVRPDIGSYNFEGSAGLKYKFDI